MSRLIQITLVWASILPALSGAWADTQSAPDDPMVALEQILFFDLGTLDENISAVLRVLDRPLRIRSVIVVGAGEDTLSEEQVLNLYVELAPAQGGFVQVRPDTSSKRFKLALIGYPRGRRLYGSALLSILRVIERAHKERGYAVRAELRERDVAALEAEDSSGVLVIHLQPEAPRASRRDLERGQRDELGPDPDSFLLPVRAVAIEGLSGKGLREEEILALPIELGVRNDVYFSRRRGLPTETFPLWYLAGPDGHGRTLRGSAMLEIINSISEAYIRRGLATTRVEIRRGTLEELALPGSDQVLTIHVTEGRVSTLRTVVRRDGRELPHAHRIRERIALESPVQPGDLVRIGELNEFVHALNRDRHRQVDVSLAPGAERGEVELHYQVQETRPWVLYSRIANTGTSATSRWRQRLGFVHRDLTGRDDVLSLGYVTAGLNDLNAFSASYERPVPGVPRLRAALSGSWTDYEATEVGVLNSDFEGHSWRVRGEAIWNAYQHNSLFLDAVAGLDFLRARVNNELAGVEDGTAFLLSRAGLRLERRHRDASTLASAAIEWNLPAAAGTDEDDVVSLGRTNADDRFAILRASVRQSVFLEPLWHGLRGGRTSRPKRRHEMVWIGRAQHTLDDQRVAPNFADVEGGLRTVRGYPEAFAIGDSSWGSTLEYRFRVPQFGVGTGPLGLPVRIRPETQSGGSDWELVLHAFLDYARTHHNRRLSFERDVELAGAGLGFQLQLVGHLGMRLDLAWALKQANNGSSVVSSGDHRAHLTFTLEY